jgi:Carboxypeptidase regulatory-like domain/TonB-dependent Receptor Plug Domain
MKTMARIVLFGLIAVAVTPLIVAQGITTGTVEGTVTDPSGAVVPAAQVELTNDANGLKLVQNSTADGSFKFFLVPIGTYHALITASGFANELVNNIRVVAGATSSLKELKLRAAGTTVQVEVNGSAAVLLDTTDSQVTTTFSTESVQNLPLNNGFDTITEVIPGVVTTGGDVYGDGFSNHNGDNFSVNGQSGRYNNFEIDGQENNDNTIAGPSVFFGSQDAIQEIQVITNDYSAQYGRNAGAVVNYITKSGSNAFHGSAFELYQGQFLSSRYNFEENPIFGFCPPGVSPSTGCLAPTIPRYVENRPGATIGGPIFRNKLFFFYSTYWDRIRTGVTPNTSSGLTPDANGLATLQSTFSGDPGAAALLSFGPYSIKEGNPQPVAVPASVAAVLPQADTCTPAAGTSGYLCDEAVTDAAGKTAMVEEQTVTRSIALPSNDQEELARVDWQATEKDRFFVRYFYQPQFGIAGGGNGIAAGDWVTVPSVGYSVGADWTHTFTPNIVDQLRYGFQESKVPFEGGAFANCVNSNFGACPAQMEFTGSNDDLTFGGDVDFPQGRVTKVTQVQNNATWTHGAQTFVFGGEFDYQNTPVTGIFYFNGQGDYGNLSNLVGAPSPGLEGFFGEAGVSSYAELANGSITTPYTEPDVAAYFQDDWRALPTLTLHLGMRWEFFGQAINTLHNETVARESNPATAFWSTALPLSDRTVPEVKQVYTNFEPRIGLAWNPDIDKKLVVSAGYAINANPSFYNIDLLVGDGAPVANLNYFPCLANACVPSSGSILNTDFRTLNLPSLPTGGDPGEDLEDLVPTNFRTPYVQTWTLGIQHQIGSAVVGSIRYVGSKTTHDFQSLDANPYLVPVVQAFPGFYPGLSLCTNPAADGYGRPNCNYSNLIYTANGGWANYNGLQLNLTTQNYHGLTSTVSYTFSKTMNNATDAFRSTGSGGSTIAFPQDPLNPSVGERGLGGNDFPNVTGLEFTYNLPNIVHENNFLSRVTNGFMLGGVYRFSSGIPYTPYQPAILDGNTGDTSFCDYAFNSSVIGVDTCRLVLSNKSAPANTVAYLNPYVNDAGTPVPGTPQYVVYGSDGFDSNGNYVQGTPVNPASTHWIINNQAYALAVNNPYPGSSRSLLRGPIISELDATIAKTTRITERLSLQLSLAAYNALNQQYLGPGDAFVASPIFTSNLYNSSGTNVPGNTSGNRITILGGKIIF